MRTLLGLLFLVFSISSRAESYCVADTAQLLAAVAAANASPQDSVIRLQTGNYSLTGQAIGAAITISGTSGLQLIGGHAPGCAVLPTATNAELTSLFVNNERRLMDIIFSSNSLNDVTVSSLNFSLGVSNSVDAAGCVTVTDAGGLGTLRIINTGFYGCRTLGPGSALNFESKSVNLELKSSEFANNISGNGAIALVMQNDATFHIANLTVSGNTNTNNITGVGGLQIGTAGGGFIWLSNNVLWGNSTSTGTDLQLNGNVVGIARNNVIGRRNASPASLVESQTLTTNPQFVNAINGDYRIKATSPLRNSGKDEIATGITDQDVEGNRRLQGTHVDRGAHEFAEILSDGFEN